MSGIADADVEAAARAICVALGYDPDAVVDDLARLPVSWWQAWTSEALAALAAVLPAREADIAKLTKANADLVDQIAGMMARQRELEREVEHWREARRNAMTAAEMTRADRDRIAGELEGAKRVIAAYHDAYPHHFVPNDCFSTGPMTGDTFYDLVRCPGCVAENEYRAFLDRTAKDPAPRGHSLSSTDVSASVGAVRGSTTGTGS